MPLVSAYSSGWLLTLARESAWAPETCEFERVDKAELEGRTKRMHKKGQIDPRTGSGEAF